MAKADIKVGVFVQLQDSSTCEVLEEPNAEQMVLVRYVEAPFEPGKVKTEALISVDEVTSWYPNRDLTHTQGTLA